MDWDALLQQSEELAAGVRRVGREEERRTMQIRRQSNASLSIDRRRGSIIRPSSSPREPLYISPRTLTHAHDHFLQSRAQINQKKTIQDSAAAAAFPRVERDLLQVEAYASALRARLARADGRGDAAAAARLLAHEGVNTRK